MNTAPPAAPFPSRRNWKWGLPPAVGAALVALVLAAPPAGPADLLAAPSSPAPQTKKESSPAPPAPPRPGGAGVVPPPANTAKAAQPPAARAIPEAPPLARDRTPVAKDERASRKAQSPAAARAGAAPSSEIAPRRAPAPPGLTKGQPVLPPRAFISRVGTFQRRGPFVEAAYRFRNDLNGRFEFWNGTFEEVVSTVVRFGAAGSVTGYQTNLRATVYKDQFYDFWIAISLNPNPDGTFNLAFSTDAYNPFGWYWWDDDMRAFPIAQP